MLLEPHSELWLCPPTQKHGPPFVSSSFRVSRLKVLDSRRFESCIVLEIRFLFFYICCSPDFPVLSEKAVLFPVYPNKYHWESGDPRD